MAHNDRKTQKLRGSRNCGFGTQKHRGAGSRGGRGNAGSKKQKWSFFSKYDPKHFSRVGFKRPQKVIRDEKIINIGKLNECVDQWATEGVVRSDGKKYIINLDEMGYDKLLGSGNVIRPMEIVVRMSSKLAVKKVISAGGKVEILAVSKEERGK